MCGRFPGQKIWSKQAKITRRGSGNPMYGKEPWNRGLTKDISDSLQQTSKKLKGRKLSDEFKKKLSESAKRRTVHGHTGHKHSKETIEFLRQNTIRLIKEGKFKQTKSRPHIAFAEILKQLNISYEEEKQLEYWSFDFYLPDYNIYIEVDGDYFHSNPKIYPNGPKTKTQKINYARDISKNKYCQTNHIQLLRFWESDILSAKEDVICKLKELLVLDT
jgi:very-short-patch-repair endonuclease